MQTDFDIVPRIDLLLYGLSFGLAVAISTALTPLVGRWAVAHDIVAQPRQDRWHSKPTPLLGGVAIYLAATLVIVAFARLDWRLLGIVGGGTLLFVTGLVDDRLHLRPHTKLILQILAACILVVGGVRVETASLAVVAIPLTIVWVVGITNAFNLLDNMDGLSSGTALIASVFLAAFSVSVGNTGNALLCLAVGGAALGFLFYNFNPARIFMGDSGSMYLGFTLSGIALLGTREMASDVFFVLLVPAAMMGLPIFDTTLVTVMRAVEGRPLSQGGRDHLSHRLVALGLSERQAVLLLYAVAVSFGSLGLIARSVGVWASVATAGVLLVVAVLLGAYLGQVRIYGPAEFARAERSTELRGRAVVNGMIMFKREIGLAGLDFVLICLAYIGAYVLRFGVPHGTPGATGTQALPDIFYASLPIMVVVKLSALMAFQAYRTMWRYVGMQDLLTIGKVTLTSTALLIVGLPLVFRHLEVPRSALIIDWFIFTTLLVGSRVSFAALTDFFTRAQQRRLPAVLIVGAGDLGELVLRSIVRAHPPRYQAVGFLDTDAGKLRRAIHGVSVIGTVDDLERLIEERDVELVVLALPQPQRRVAQDVAARCAVLDLACYPAAAFVELHFGGRAEESEPTAAPSPAPRSASAG